jgi:hypothetical protein
LPATFNKLRKQIETGKRDPSLAAAVGSLEWYRKVHELRTEWVHYSTIFVARRGEEPLLVAAAHRSRDDRQEFPDRAHFTVPELVSWIQQATAAMDSFAGYLLHKYVVPSFDRRLVYSEIVRDQKGYPVPNEGGGVVLEQIAVGEYLRRIGL